MKSPAKRIWSGSNIFGLRSDKERRKRRWKGCTWIYQIVLIPCFVLATNSLLASDSPAATVPFELHGHFMVVKREALGLRDLNFAIDTGASLAVMDIGIAKKLNLPTREAVAKVLEKKTPVRETTIQKLIIGTQTFEDFTVQLVDLSQIGGKTRVRIDGLIGLDLLKKTNLRIDFENRTVTFGLVVSHGNSHFSFSS